MIMNIVSDDLLLVHQVAAIIGRTPETVRALERAGKLPARRLGNMGARVFSRRDVEDYMRAHAGRQPKPAASDAR